MLLDSRVLTSESDNLLPVEIIKQPRVDLPRELKKTVADIRQERWTITRRVSRHLVEELIQQLNVDEHRGGVGQLLSDDVQESFGAEKILIRPSLAPF